jgi:hypothetical protein
MLRPGEETEAQEGKVEMAEPVVMEVTEAKETVTGLTVPVQKMAVPEATVVMADAGVPAAMPATAVILQYSIQEQISHPTIQLIHSAVQEALAAEVETQVNPATVD